MAKETKYSITDLRTDFPTDEVCLAFLFDSNHSRDCSCGGVYKQIRGRKQFQCSKCRFQIAPTAGSIFHKSDTPFTLWFHAIWIFANAKSGISAKELERHLGVTYKCAWRILSLIRKALKQSDTKLHGDVEIDVGYFGGRAYGGKNNEQSSDAWKKKVVIAIAVERGGRMKGEIISKSTTENMTSFIKRNVETKLTSILTDASRVYEESGETYDRHMVNHSKREFVRGDVHINTVETFFSHVKRSIRGTFKSLSRQHLQSYLDAFVFHYNTRHNDRERFGVLLGNVLGA